MFRCVNYYPIGLNFLSPEFSLPSFPEDNVVAYVEGRSACKIYTQTIQKSLFPTQMEEKSWYSTV